MDQTFWAVLMYPDEPPIGGFVARVVHACQQKRTVERVGWCITKCRW